MVANRIFALAFFPLGLGALLLGGHDVLEGRRSLAWTAVPATVLSARLSPRVWGVAQPEIRYTYAVDEDRFVSDQLWPGANDMLPVVRPSTGRAIVERHPEGATVTVRVNPKNAGESVLFPGAARPLRWTGLFAFFLGLGVALPFGIEKWILRFRSRSSRP